MDLAITARHGNGLNQGGSGGGAGGAGLGGISADICARHLSHRLSDLWPLCDAFDKYRGRYSLHTYYLSTVSPPHFYSA